MIKVKSIKEHNYAGRRRYAGEVYEAEDRYVKVLITVGFVEVEGPGDSKPDSAPTYKRRDLRAQK